MEGGYALNKNMAVCEWINEWMNEWMNQWMNEWMNELYRCDDDWDDYDGEHEYDEW